MVPIRARRPAWLCCCLVHKAVWSSIGLKYAAGQHGGIWSLSGEHAETGFLEKTNENKKTMVCLGQYKTDRLSCIITDTGAGLRDYAAGLECYSRFRAACDLRAAVIDTDKGTVICRA